MFTARIFDQEPAIASLHTSKAALGPRGRLLPPLDYLLAFEAAAKFGSFASASKQMNISETAISRKVRLLEQHFAVTFFIRRHRSIELSAQGKAFLNRIYPALEALRSCAEDTMSISHSRPVVLAATNSVASLWLGPRLQAFRQKSRHLKIMLVSSDSDQECLAATVDLTILRGNGTWPGYDTELLFGETIFPVCSPEFLAANPAADRLDALSAQPLIEVASAHTEWMNWRTWLQQIGAPQDALDQTVAFNTYPLSIQAAVDGVGLALGWGHLVDHLLASGQLVRPLGRKAIRTRHGYHLLVPNDRPLSSGASETRNWLLELSAHRKRYDPTEETLSI